MYIAFIVSLAIMLCFNLIYFFLVYGELDFYICKKSINEFFNKNCYYTPTNEEIIIYEKYKKKLMKKEKRKEKLAIIIPIIVSIIIIILISWFGAILERNNLNRDIEGYKMAKYTIEESLKNEDLTGLEKVELVKQASEQNQWLGKQKYSVKLWYNFHLDKENVLSLEEIKLNKGD